MNLEIKFRKIGGDDCVEFNVDCHIDDNAQDLLHAEVPIEIDELTDLDLTYDGNTPMLRRIPDTIGRLTSLELLIIVDNELTSIPSSIGNLPNLQILYLNSNRLTSIPRSIGNLTHLTQINLSDNHLTALPTTIGNLINLEYLNLNNNRLTSLPIMENCISLKGLKLANNRLTMFPRIENLPLEELELTNNPITRIPASIVNLTAEICRLPDDILLYPMQKEYIFTSEVVLNEVKNVFNIRRYNEMMQASAKEKNRRERKSIVTVKQSLKEHFSKNRQTRTNSAAKVLFNNRFAVPISSFLGERHRTATIDDVLKLDMQDYLYTLAHLKRHKI